MTFCSPAYSDALDAIADACGGYVLGTGPRRDHNGKVISSADHGEWDAVRSLPRATLRRLVALGMAGKVRPLGASLPSGLRGVPTDPGTLAHAITERGLGPSDMAGADALDWYLGQIEAVRGMTDAVSEWDARPEPDPLPTWVDVWLKRMVCPTKREFALQAARCVYNDEAGPQESGRPWETAVWRKISNRYNAERTRAELHRERVTA